MPPNSFETTEPDRWINVAMVLGCHPVSNVWQAKRSCAPSLCDMVLTKRDFVHHFRHIGHQFRNLKAGHIRLDRARTRSSCAQARSNFGSKVSNCDGPPSIQSKITDFACGPGRLACADAACNRNRSVKERVNPRNPTAADLHEVPTRHAALMVVILPTAPLGCYCSTSSLSFFRPAMISSPHASVTLWPPHNASRTLEPDLTAYLLNVNSSELSNAQSVSSKLLRRSLLLATQTQHILGLRRCRIPTQGQHIEVLDNMAVGVWRRQSLILRHQMRNTPVLGGEFAVDASTVNQLQRLRQVGLESASARRRTTLRASDARTPPGSKSRSCCRAPESRANPGDTARTDPASRVTCAIASIKGSAGIRALDKTGRNTACPWRCPAV